MESGVVCYFQFGGGVLKIFSRQDVQYVKVRTYVIVHTVSVSPGSTLEQETARFSVKTGSVVSSRYRYVLCFIEKYVDYCSTVGVSSQNSVSIARAEGS